MTQDSFRRLVEAKPFKPFRLIMSSGRSYDVPHPEMVIVGRSDLHVMVLGRPDDAPSEFRTCPMLHVATIEPLSVPAS